VANLPYSVASPILVELAQSNGCPERMVVTLQLEVAQRLVARPDDEHYGLLTLLIQLRYEPRGWFKIPASCFFPAPEVDSACVTLMRRPGSLFNEAQTPTFTKIVKRAFSQRRKMMFKLLKEDWPEERLDRAFRTGGISLTARAETINLERFLELTRNLASQTPR
jgi:16S rRNA (adenine1518-N6/adenine1519-N6)-dimethyltransferase